MTYEAKQFDPKISPAKIVSKPFYNPETKERVLNVFTGVLNQFNFTVTMRNPYGTYIISDPVAVEVIYNCHFFDATPNPVSISPKEIEQSFFPSAIVFSQPNGTQPRFLFNSSINEYKQVTFNLSSRIYNNASEFCPIVKYAILKIVNLQTGQEIETSRHQLYASLNESGLVTLVSLNRILDYAVYLTVSNRLKTLDIVNPVMRVFVYKPPRPLPNLPPYFDGQIMFRDINLDDYEIAEVVKITLPPIRDTNSSSKFNVEIIPKVSYLVYDPEANKIEVSLGKVPASDIKFILF